MRPHRWDFDPQPCREPAHLGSTLRCHDCNLEYFCAPEECPSKRRRPGFEISGPSPETEEQAGAQVAGQPPAPASSVEAA